MTRKIRILWIDDECENHKEDVKNLEDQNRNLLIDIIHPIELVDKLKAKMKKPDLFLVDYFLNQLPSPDGKLFSDKGLTIAGKLKETYPELPVYGVSHLINEGMFGTDAQLSKAIFEKILTFQEVQNQGADILYWDAWDFKQIRKIPKKEVDALFKLLKAPDIINNKIQQVLPDDLRQGLGTKQEGNTIAFARWTQQFLSLPGFLYDELYAATHLGITPKKFIEISHRPKFKKIKYSGIFSKTNPTLWWVSELNNLIYSTTKINQLKGNNPWELAPQIFNIQELDSSKCIVCGERYPEIVGIDLRDENHKAPVHYRCSEPYPSSKRELFFDEIRGFKLSQ